ncbi:copper homeostasis protein cutC homolog [Nymphalis io]|uniref:copper homeostasis protein cutC homolog n=1 Tax=Inachis io TaxID=171585 RepID=UPI002166C93B|nr:copper homeostasis protein cutC homolog [Nymphalis io]
MYGEQYPSEAKLKLEVCIDSLESARNAIQGGADELEVCSSLAEGGLTPSPGLVKEILRLVINKPETPRNNKKPKVNVMIRCRGGSDFCYTNNEMETMLADIEIYGVFGVDRFVFGALTKEQEIDKENCMKVLNKARPIPVTFHRAFDLCKQPKVAINDIIGLGFNRILTSGQKPSAADETALQLLDFLFKKYNDKIEIMPGAGVNCDNVTLFVKSGFSIIHSSCKKIKQLPDVGGDLNMGSNKMYVTDENIVKKIKQYMKIK